MLPLEVNIVEWSTSASELEGIRTLVFVQEQHVPRDLEMDDRDPYCTHVLASLNHEIMGTGRIDLPENGKIGRVAVLRPFRNRGVGTALMQALENVARNAGLSRVWLNAQVAALPFYRSLDYQSVGSHFLEADIVHCKMVKRI